MEERGTKLHLTDCPESIQGLVRTLAEQFQESVTWPKATTFHLLRQRQHVPENDFNAFGHQTFEQFPEDGLHRFRVQPWALFDTGRFTRLFSDAHRIIDSAFTTVNETEDRVILTRDDIARLVRREPSDQYLSELAYILSKAYVGYQVHPEQGWQLVIEVLRATIPTPSIEDLLLQRPTLPSAWAATEAMGSKDALSAEASGLALNDKTALIFVSCGQVTSAEIKLGKDICELIDAIPGLTSYFAQNVASPEALSSNIFRNLNNASAVIAVMHHRGTVEGRPDDAARIRASVWIEQEIAIAAFLTAVQGRKIHLAAYSQRGLSREGVRDNLILNPVDFDNETEVLEDVRLKLASWRLAPQSQIGPRVTLDMAFARLGNSDGERHVYELRVKMTNAGTEIIDAFDATLDFPSAFVLGAPGTIGMERLDLAREGYRVFRHNNFRKARLLPGDSLPILTLPYQVTTELYSNRAATFALPVTVKVYVAGQLAGTASTAFHELQEF